jgi:mRNA interferase YafQ
MKIRETKQFTKDYNRLRKQGYNLTKIEFVIKQLASGNTLPITYFDHELSGNYSNCRECHIKFDWLLIYLFEQIEINETRLVLIRTGTHAQLFG